MNQLRSLRVAAAPDSIYITDPGKEGVFRLESTDTKSPDNTGTTVVTVDGLRYKRDFVGAANASWFGVSPEDNDIGPELQNAVNSSNEVIIPDGEYTQLTKVIIHSNLAIRGNPGRVKLKLTGDNYISFQNYWLEQNLENITIEGIDWLVASTAHVDGSYGPITFDGPSVKNLLVQNCHSVHTSPTARVNFFFLKVQPGKVTDNIVVTKNSVTGARMGVEFLSQRQPVPYLGKNITVSENYMDNCGFGISIAGSFVNAAVDNNYLKNCPTYGVEFAGWLHSSRLANNRFEGSFAAMFSGNWENDGDGTVGEGTRMYGNSTVGTCNGKWEIRNGFNMIMENNYINMTGVLALSGSTNNAQFVGNTLISTTQNKVIEINDVGNLRFANNYISNESVPNNWFVIWMNGGAATNNSFYNNTIVKSSGNYIGAGNGASYSFYNNADRNGAMINQ
ncbi:hypothetical protein ACFSUS_01550 [Spirosoma soli]|uniref:Right-handed parallel beta-helix repeat-containing protein n=2 Tax=Spirosoma soli TaxID=1770529 RepID=A0ABW5LY89_9BACT